MVVNVIEIEVVRTFKDRGVPVFKNRITRRKPTCPIIVV